MKKKYLIILNFDEALEFLKSLKTKRCRQLFKDVCMICNNEWCDEVTRLNKRIYKVNVCGKCYVPKYVCKQQQWKDNNSKAQLVAQNKPETLKKNSDSVKKHWKENPEKRKQMGEKISKLYNDSEKYRKAVNTSPYRGFIETNKFGKIRFDSCLELSFIIQSDNDNNINNFCRWEKGIEYTFENKIKHYFPDFIINNDKIIEVKSKFLYEKHSEQIKAKQEAVKNQYSEFRYCFFDYENCKKKYQITSKNYSRQLINLNYHNKVLFSKQSTQDKYEIEIKKRI